MKLEGQPNIQSLAESPPPRGRGLKLCRRLHLSWIPHVAPPAGAWIETQSEHNHSKPIGRPPRGGVD